MTIPESTLSNYIQQFSKLRRGRGPNWTSVTKGQAPHKPFLLLSVIDLYAESNISSNLVEITPELAELFSVYWKIVLPSRRGNLSLPFFHLRTSDFWHLVPQPGQDAILAATTNIFSLEQLNRMILGATLDDDLHILLEIKESRDLLRSAITQTYFAPEYQLILFNQGQLNLQAYKYSQLLIEKAKKKVKDKFSNEQGYKSNVRDQGFRKAVVRVYEHRCAFCGVRMLTSAGHTAVDAAHIVPWRITQNDDLHNGMALCRLCHWTFDEGLTGVSKNYQVLLSKELRTMENLPGHLLTVENRQILGPTDDKLWPDTDAIKWHRHKVFLKG